MTSTAAASAAEFIEEMGIMTQADDLPRIAGRIMGLLVLEEDPVSFADIAERLKVSRASVSTNARLLVETGILERVAMPGDRQDYYRLNPAWNLRLLRRVVTRIERMKLAVQAASAALPDDRSAARARLDGLCEFYGAVSRSLEALAGAAEGAGMTGAPGSKTHGKMDVGHA
jgi:DNA-binding transcriptional regulator GbsR (MarR family)